MSPLQRTKLVLAPLGWWLLKTTVRVRPDEPDAPAGACIFACLHRDILPAILHVRGRRPVLMVSDSPDGDILVRTLGERDFGFVRGSSEAGGGRALLTLCRLVEGGRCAGLAVDGPKGPYGEIREGVLRLAQLSGAPIVPLRARARSAVVLGTWDRTVVPLPFGRVDLEAGRPVRLERAAGAAAVATARDGLRRFFGVAGGEA